MKMSKEFHGTFCWNELMTKDTAAAKEFYTKLLDWESREMPMPDGAYTIFKAGDKDAGGMMAITPEMGEIPSHWMSYIAVDDVEARSKLAGELGGNVLVPPTDIPGVGRFSIIQDPTGLL